MHSDGDYFYLIIINVSNRNPHTERFPPVARENFLFVTQMLVRHVQLLTSAQALHYAALCLHLCNLVLLSHVVLLFFLSLSVHEEPSSAAEDRFSH